MRAVHHSPAYVAELGSVWQVVVPIRGRLSAHVLAPKFATRCAAAQWLASEEGQRQVALKRHPHAQG